MSTHSQAAGTAQGAGLDRELLVLGGVVVLGSILAILDATIVNVAIPTLGAEFGASISSVQWVMTAYLLAFASVIPLSAWASDRFGARRVFIAALGVFMTGSALAATAWSIESLIAFRVVQGLGGGMIMPVGQAILARAAGPERMGRVMSVVGVPMLLGPIFGPIIGGALVDAVSWRWIFIVNLPVGTVAIALAWRLLPRTAPGRHLRLDTLGLLLLSPGIAIFVYGMSEAASSGGFTSTATLVGVGVGTVLIGLFVRHALPLGPQALLDLTLLRRRGFATAAATNLLVGVALFGALLLLPLYYQLVRGETALATGLLLVPQGVGAALAMPLAGWLTDEIGARRVVPSGIALALAGTAVFTQIGADTSYALLGAALFVIGLGLGSTIVPSMAVAFQAVPREAVGQASSMINVTQRIAGSVGTALLAVVLQRQIGAELPNLGGIDALSALPPAARDAVAPALAAAFADAFRVAFVLLIAALPAALLLPRTRTRRASAGAAPAGREAPAR